MRVLVAGTWDTSAGYPRTRSLLAALRHGGAQVDELRVEPATTGAERQGLLRRPWAWPGYLLRGRRLQRELRRRLEREIERTQPDLVLVPYPGHSAVHTVRKVWKGPLVLDLFLSVFDTAVGDRGQVHPGSLAARMLLRLDRRACEAADLVLVDTPQNAEYLRQLCGLVLERVHWVPVGDPMFEGGETAAFPAPQGDPLRLLFFGTGVPLHGLRDLLAAVDRTDGVQLTLVGGSAEDRADAESLGGRVRILPEFVDSDVLRQEIADAELVAGVFGTSRKARSVLPFKVSLALAMGRPVITGDTPAARTFLSDDPCCFLARPGDPAAIAAALREAIERRAELAEMGAAAQRCHRRHLATPALSQRLMRSFAELVGEPCADPEPMPRSPEVPVR